MTLDLQKFCADERDDRQELRKPFSYGKETAATNGHIIIVVQKQDVCEKTICDFSDTLKINVMNVIASIPKNGYSSMPKIKWPKKEVCYICQGGKKAVLNKCEECSGDGYITFQTANNFYECECKMCAGIGGEVKLDTDTDCHCCKGVGEIYPVQSKRSRVVKPIRFEGMLLDPTYLEMFAKLKDVQYQKKEPMVYFQFDGGRGAIISMSE